MESKDVFKIKHKKTGKYFSQLNTSHIGFNNCKWNETGKIWNDIRDIEKILDHERHYKPDSYEYFFEYCDVVQCIIKEVCVIKLNKR